MKKKKGILLLNLGTPSDPSSPKAVGRYLNEFLMDKEVIDLPTPLRWILVKALIVPRRKFASSKLYQSIWQNGSPLLEHTLELSRKLQDQLGDNFEVQAAMRYQKPSIEATLQEFSSLESLLLVPLYPQYSTAATRSSIQQVKKHVSSQFKDIPFAVLPSFFEREEFLNAVSEKIEQTLRQQKYDHLLFSYHGLPLRQLRKLNVSCMKTLDCCEKKENISICYRAQCFETTRRLAQKLKLPSSFYTVCFQSRIKGTPWITPFTDKLYESFPKQGKKKIAVVCPSFVADCLETLEEVALRGKKTFISHGGERLDLIPCINSSSTWVQGLAKMVQDVSF